MINTEFPKFIEYLKDKQFGEIAIITNGQLMDEEKMRCMIDNSIDRVAFSIDGLRKEYEEIRAPIKYEEIIGIVSQFYQLRREKGKRRPLIRIQSVKTSIKMEKEFLKIWEPTSDEILFLEYKDYSEESGEKPQAAYRCPLLYQRLMIHWDGTVPMCINDEYEESVMGNVLEENIGDIWNGAAFVKARKIHKQDVRDASYSNCSKCALHREGHGK